MPFRLLGFITDYLTKRGYTDTVRELYKENNDIKLIPRDRVKNLIDSVDEIRGNSNKNESVLFEWWKVFWNILKETKRGGGKSLKRSSVIEENTQTKCENNSIRTAILSTNASPNPNLNTVTEHPYKKLKKQPVPINSNESMNTLDISSLTGIEKSLLSSNLMNKDLTKLTAEERKKVETALKNNKVSKESWEIYLRLCKEYQKMPQILKNPKISKIPLRSDFIACNSSNYLGVIDQVNQPIDSRQLLILRQSLYQEYLKKQTSACYTGTPSNINISNGSDTILNVKNNMSSNCTNVSESNNPTPNFFDDNIFGPFEIKDELNFNDFMNEYLI